MSWHVALIVSWCFLRLVILFLSWPSSFKPPVLEELVEFPGQHDNFFFSVTDSPSELESSLELLSTLNATTSSACHRHCFLLD